MKCPFLFKKKTPYFSFLFEVTSPSHSGRLFFINSCKKVGTAVAQWLRCCATNRKVAGSIPDGVNGFFIDIKYFRSHYGPGGSTQPLTEMSTKSVSWG